MVIFLDTCMHIFEDITKICASRKPWKVGGRFALAPKLDHFRILGISSARTCMAICMINIRPSLRPVRSDLLDILIERRNLTSCGRPNQQHEVFFCNRCRRAPGGAAAPSHPTWDCGSDGLIACRRPLRSPTTGFDGEVPQVRRRPAKSSADTEAAHETATNLADRRRLSAVRREGAGLSAGTMRRRL